MRNEIQDRHLLDQSPNLNTQDSWNLFQNAISGLIERHIPKKRYLSITKPPWLNRHLKGFVKENYKAWNKFRKDKSDAKWEIYTRCRNEASRQVIKANTEYEEKIALDSKKILNSSGNMLTLR
jgi:hypothetical protein